MDIEKIFAEILRRMRENELDCGCDSPHAGYFLRVSPRIRIYLSDGGGLRFNNSPRSAYSNGCCWILVEPPKSLRAELQEELQAYRDSAEAVSELVVSRLHEDLFHAPGCQGKEGEL